MLIPEVMKKIKIASIHQIVTMYQSCAKQIIHGTHLLLPATSGGRCPHFSDGKQQFK